jgi:hypothetical protein
MSNLEGIEGFVTDIKSCLQQYGIVCRREKSDQYYFIYKTPSGFDEGFLCESEINDLILGKSYFTGKQVSDFLLSINENISKFVNHPILYKVYTLINYFGVEEIMGKSISSLTLNEALYILEKE